MPEPEAAQRRHAAPAPPAADFEPSHEAPLTPEASQFIERLRLGYTPLFQRLAALRRRARSGARTAAWLGTLCPLCAVPFTLAGLAGGLYFWQVLYQQITAKGGLSAGIILILQLELILIPVACLYGTAHALLQACTLHKLFAYYYRQALSRLERQGEALFYVFEDYHQLFEDARERGIGWQVFFQPRERQRSIEKQLEYLACYGEPLRRAARLNPITSRYEYLRARQVYRSQFFFSLPAGVWGLCILLGAVPLALMVSLVVSAVLGTAAGHGGPAAWLPMLVPLLPLFTMLLVIPLALGYQLSPRYTISRARLVALLDFLLEQPQLDLAALEPPAEPRGWLARQLAPWSSRERVPR
jgi:hypothetical protein